MNLFGTPVLKIRTKDRLHITKEPGIMSWVTVATILSMVLGISYYLIPDYFVLSTASLTLCLLLSLNLMETWDFIMDKEENLVTLVTRSWYHGFSMKVPEENVKRFPLSFIKSVVVNPDSGIDIIKKDGTRTPIKSDGQDFTSLRKLRKEIATFLHLEKIEYLKANEKVLITWDIDPWNIDLTEFQDADSGVHQNSHSQQQETQYEFGRNIKVITGSL